MINKRILGTKLEDAACLFLIKNGYNIIKRNFRVGKLGEADIIAADGEYICFVEVMGRSSEAFGTPAEAVIYRKKATLRKLASVYSAMNGNNEINIRFDIVEIYFTKIHEDFSIDIINLIKSAF